MIRPRASQGGGGGPAGSVGGSSGAGAGGRSGGPQRSAAASARSAGRAAAAAYAYRTSDAAEWVLEQGRDGNPPSPEEIVRQAIATIVAETPLAESGDQDDGGHGRPCGPVLQESRCG